MKTPDPQGAAKIGWFTKLRIKIACADEATLRLCPPDDLQHVKTTAELQIGTTTYQAALFTLISERLFGSPDQLRIDLVAGSIFIALFIQRIDASSVIASQWHLSGIEEIKRGGLDIYGGVKARIKAYIFLGLRILLSLDLAQLSAVFVSLLVFHDDIAARIQNAYIQSNAPIAAEAKSLVDSEIRRATEALTDQSARIAVLSTQATALRQKQIDPGGNDPQIQEAQQEIAQLLALKAGADDHVRQIEAFAAADFLRPRLALRNSGVAGNRRKRRAAEEEIANTRARAHEIDNRLDAARGRLDALRERLSAANEATKRQSHEQLPLFESSLAAENTKLATLQDKLAALTRGRDDAIRDAINHSPEHVPLNNGFLARISALESVVRDDPSKALIILLIDVGSFGLELAAVLVTVTNFQPTTYSALIARDAYLRAVNIADEIAREIDPSVRKINDIARTLSRDRPSNDNDRDNGPTHEPGPRGPDEPPPPPKRPRGRPRKYPREEA